MNRFCCCLALLCSLAAASSAFAGAIQGTVIDPDGAPISGALVELFEVFGPLIIASTITDASGEYSLTAALDTLYEVTASAAGFQPATSPPLIVTASADVELIIVLLPLDSTPIRVPEPVLRCKDY